jgi:hypothetical protein
MAAPVIPGRKCYAIAADAGRPHTSRDMKYLAIIAAIGAAIVLSQLLFDFYDWNKTQSCASTGGRNCGGAGPIPLGH